MRHAPRSLQRRYGRASLGGLLEKLGLRKAKRSYLYVLVYTPTTPDGRTAPQRALGPFTVTDVFRGTEQVERWLAATRFEFERQGLHESALTLRAMPVEPFVV